MKGKMAKPFNKTLAGLRLDLNKKSLSSRKDNLQHE